MHACRPGVVLMQPGNCESCGHGFRGFHPRPEIARFFDQLGEAEMACRLERKRRGFLEPCPINSCRDDSRHNGGSCVRDRRVVGYSIDLDHSLEQAILRRRDTDRRDSHGGAVGRAARTCDRRILTKLQRGKGAPGRGPEELATAAPRHSPFPSHQRIGEGPGYDDAAAFDQKLRHDHGLHRVVGDRAGGKASRDRVVVRPIAEVWRRAEDRLRSSAVELLDRHPEGVADGQPVQRS